MFSVSKGLSAVARLAAALIVSLVCAVAPTHAKALKVALVLPGPISDNDWNAGGYNGLMDMKKISAWKLPIPRMSPMPTPSA